MASDAAEEAEEAAEAVEEAVAAAAWVAASLPDLAPGKTSAVDEGVEVVVGTSCTVEAEPLPCPPC